jgi:hypothetical protein
MTGGGHVLHLHLHLIDDVTTVFRSKTALSALSKWDSFHGRNWHSDASRQFKTGAGHGQEYPRRLRIM